MLSSKGEARRMIQNGGVKINEEKVEDVQLQVEINDDLILQVGKRKFMKIIK
jgi:tyrosyl-tRNA synthetase